MITERLHAIQRNFIALLYRHLTFSVICIFENIAFNSKNLLNNSFMFSVDRQIIMRIAAINPSIRCHLQMPFCQMAISLHSGFTDAATEQDLAQFRRLLTRTIWWWNGTDGVKSQFYWRYRSESIEIHSKQCFRHYDSSNGKEKKRLNEQKFICNIHNKNSIRQKNEQDVFQSSDTDSGPKRASGSYSTTRDDTEGDSDDMEAPLVNLQVQGITNTSTKRSITSHSTQIRQYLQSLN